MIVYRSQSEFNDIVVTQKGSVVTLWSPSDVKQSAVNLERPYLPDLEYARNTILSLAFFPDPSSVLVIGLGGGTIPRMFHTACANATIDVVEIDPEMLSIARRFFQFRPADRISVIHEDAFSYCGRTEKRYDIIVMDAYIGERQPDPLTSAGFFRIAANCLTGDGVFANNLMKGKGHFFDDKCRRLRSVFAYVQQLPGETKDNIIVFASQKKRSRFEFIKNAAVTEQSLPFAFPMTRLAEKIVPVTHKPA